ncbi:alkanesulfonate monooxygenase SsuD/methylene tetrahydromethanopterin reductase-like flavin-dependent oxidoreductase (luciferase family) [Krasilnikovia cinnamomea]|uniref:Alkanesulfonate monooxygenase SsuD/methylene tetrahydromethanopterin reductase-like flavin-dependent oxidoreductase (Luciferase family) n=1 Tax=Krasilnikovia cinnamomea TaxID=349313 RepID=A0A4Q7ZK83_9ACTN|nr:LLM class flavin-dependent oxidoreductase [Krasilnikovia cinnamomea]RZU51338.1 alkanesulfonate monooxygenase SsuD/methylene tetrahydromethanopterin reductase-like flavin-dependent oxidoreductase (luciferase family) [Krasilnikovia cinnamomea]
MRRSILLPFAPTQPEHVVPFAKLVQQAGATRLWQGQGMVLESHQLAAWLAGRGLRVPVGFGVSLMPFRSPYLAALEARSTAMATGHPVVAGFGPGSAQLQAALLGSPYRKPLQAARDYLRAVRGLLAGDAEQALVPAVAPPVQVGLGVLRPRMARLAGEAADVAITWLCSADYVRTTLIPSIRAAERTLEAPVQVTAIVPCALADPDRDLTALVEAACGAHSRAPHYADVLRRSGVELRGAPTRDAHRLADSGVFLYGSAEDIHQRLDAYRAAGVDEVVLNVTGVASVYGPRAAARDLLALLRA